ncbi:hypothetical protein EST38_g502 [Candolleomyces aberdarensis]|uniref:Dynactin subunit 4 n=1 Tax=Candolleomyces aberdarensis TaxID=2316362 RepID=A0A4Q2DZD9_9AGAR|nr:hypothetical protein EST38_g502 [Candolleomyces aberdarensis]
MFEKPTGVAAQLQKYEDSAPDSLEFDRLKEHFDGFFRATALASSTSGTHGVAHSSGTAHSHSLHSNSITAAASAALARDIPGVGKYNALARSTSNRGYGKDRSVNKDEMTEYRSRSEVSKAAVGGERDVELLNSLEEVDSISRLEQRWENSWIPPLQTKEMKPLRIPLHSKRSKRCPACTHILIKPEQKAQSVRYKIKLVAANYLPGIQVVLPHVRQMKDDISKRNLGKSVSVQVEEPSIGMTAGKIYEFQLTLTNPLYDPIEVKLSVPRIHISTERPTLMFGQSAIPGKGEQEKENKDVERGEKEDDKGKAKAKVPAKAPTRSPFAVSLPTQKFTISAFAEAWEYDDDEDMFGVEDDELGIGGHTSAAPSASSSSKVTRDKDGRTRPKTVGVLERKSNKTVVGGEVVIGKEARGHIKFNMLVDYTYRSDDPAPSESGDLDSHAARSPEIKVFSFYTVVDLGPIIPREEVKLDL